eukprot:TRINITY_DN36102_c0_g1_i1.p1 TRINITY_DN36102_c0_g1~~TRINITY_DN36102_c0_g1_i1.p1  ORF type:complete len:484 (-),score=76.35 TRINITY_DN36102_c0_g1_i1:158-1609(-)
MARSLVKEEEAVKDEEEDDTGGSQKSKRRRGAGWGAEDWQGMDSELGNRIYEQVYEAAGECIAPVVNLETSWTPEEMVKRITRHICKSACNAELAAMALDVLCHTLVEGAFHGYTASCSEREWFYDCDLVPAFCCAAFELLCHHGRQQEVVYLEEMMQLSFGSCLERTLIDKAMWDCIKNVFEVFDEKVQYKIYRALSASYWSTMDNVIQHHFKPPVHGTTPDVEAELKCAEKFLEDWISTTLQRGWNSAEPPESLWTEQAVGDLFGLLVCPFGEESGFSCIPGVLVTTIGYPRAGWIFVQEAVADMFASWNKAGSKRRKRGSTLGLASKLASYGFKPPSSRSNGRSSSRSSSSHPTSQPAPAERQEQEHWSNGRSGHEAKTRHKPSRSAPKPAHPPETQKPMQMKPKSKAPAKKPPAKSKVAAGLGHASCTSRDECIGSPQSRLVQHLVVHAPETGDVYCEPCWCTFVRRNPNLEGTFLEEV